MGPQESVAVEELGAYHHWVSFKGKMLALAEELQRRLRTDAFRDLIELTYRGVQNKNIQGHVGLTWCAPANKSASDSRFWYFLGFAFNPANWSLTLLAEAEPECVAFVGIWPEDVERFRGLLVGSCQRLVGQGFDISFSEDGKGLLLVRRRPLRSFLSCRDQRSAILDFLKESHDQVLESGELPDIFNLYQGQQGGIAAVEHDAD